MRRRVLYLPACSFLLVVSCGSEETGPSCTSDQEVFRGECVDPDTRYEPPEALDTDNVSAFGDPLEVLDLPPPPKSGFRIVAPPRVLEPGEEIEGCIAWPIPDIQRNVVYSARLYTTPGLHHSNVIAKPIDPELGESPYPDCRPGAGDAFEDIFDGIPDVLFANSTQVVGEERIVFPQGVGYRLDTSREIVTSIHWLNPTAEPLRVEVAYDFYTMADEDLVREVAPFVMTILDFTIPPKTSKTVETTCEVFGGEVFTLMPHTHNLIKRFSVDLVSFEDEQTQVLDQVGYDTDSDIESFEPPIDLDDVAKIHYACEFDNVHDQTVTYGIGQNEMCILFGYVYPPRSQFAAFVDTEGEACTSAQIGVLRPQ